MVANCKHYNADGTWAFNEAAAIDKYFTKGEHSIYYYYAKILLIFDIEMERVKNTLKKFNERQQANAQTAVPPVAEVMPPPRAPAAVPSRPTIKLNLPSKTKAKDSPRVSPTPAATSSSAGAPKPKKPKIAVDLPPPPYVDDGSHDLLQEVIAIENQRDGKRPSGSIKINAGKRKRSPTNVTEADKDLISAVSKKDRPSPAPSQSARSEATPKPKPKLVIAPKHKKPAESVPASPAVSASPAPASVPATPTPAPSRKGKEKEVTPSVVPTPSATPLKPKQAPTASTPIDVKKCREILKALLRVPEAIIFTRPVDPELDGCPT
jgi:transcription initiation factor TFIID subunit 2